MIKLNSETKNALVIQGSQTLGNPVLLFEKRMRIPLNNSDRDMEEIRTYAKYKGWVRGCQSSSLASPLSSLYVSIMAAKDETRIIRRVKNLYNYFFIFFIVKNLTSHTL